MSVGYYGNPLAFLFTYSLTPLSENPPPLTPVDLDQSGASFQQVATYLGPSLGWVHKQVKSARLITVGGFYDVPSGGVILINTEFDPVTINLPNVSLWVKEPGYRPPNNFEAGVWIKDFRGNASFINITVVPFGTQTIDGATGPVIIDTDFGILRLYPLDDLNGWYIA